MIPIVTIEGPTGSGKSAFAIELAKHLNTEIISADSRQVYKYMNIGTAKVGPTEQEQVKHHLIDIVTPHESYNAGSFAMDASSIIRAMSAEGKLPIVCGGTGLYIQSLLKGLCALPKIEESVRIELQNKLCSEGLEKLYGELSEVDAELAGKLSPNDRQRILRGLEVFHGTGKALSQHWKEQQDNQTYKPFRIIINPQREVLYKRINARLSQMLKTGLIEEIRGLLEMGYNSDSPGLNSLGYKEFMAYLRSEASLQSCVELAAQHHRNYAKRQVTWYRKCSFNLALADISVNISEIGKIIEVERTEESYANIG